VKKNVLSLLLTAGIFLLCSCASSMRPLTSRVKFTDVSDIQKFETFSYISFIAKGNRTMHNDSISAISKTLFSETLAANPKIPVTAAIVVADTSVLLRVEKEVNYLLSVADKKRDITRMKITPVLDSLLESEGKRFGLLTVTTGFSRAPGNYDTEVTKGAAIGILTLGMYYQVPVKATSTMYAMVVDAKENNIAFFKKVSNLDKEPLDKAVLTKQVHQLFNGYFWYTW
jgi:hypothetical protein